MLRNCAIVSQHANKIAESSTFSLDADIRESRGTALEIEFHGARVSLTL